MRACHFPGCGASLEGKKSNTRWCDECRRKMRSNRASRNIAKKTRSALFPFQNCVPGRKAVERNEHREPEIVCKHCFGMPWARRSDRFNERSGQCLLEGHGDPVAVNGICRGCGEHWAPEPKLELCGTVRSSAAMAVEHGRLFGSEPTPREGHNTGRRKGAKEI
jgi:hypothetical protein